MYNVELSDNAVSQITAFTYFFHKKNIEMFVDCGIDEEDVIIERYISLSQKLRDKIYQEIVSHFSQKTIAKKMLSSDETLSYLQVGGFRLFVYYREDISSMIRYIESVEFYRK